MKNFRNRLICIILAIVMLVSAMPLAVIADEEDSSNSSQENINQTENNITSVTTPEYLEMSDGYVRVKVSVDNGGFYVGTAEGDVVTKSDNNKDITFNDSEFDTSFTSFRVKRGDRVNDYIFGRSYAYLGIETSEVNVYFHADNTIVAEWQVDGILFKQTVALMGADTYQHGMAYVAYTATNVSGTAVDSIEARVLVDTALGHKDYAYYMLGQNDGSYVEVGKERSISGEDYSNYFFAYDDKVSPSVTAYTLNGTVGGFQVAPKKVTFAHWLNLASTVFDYTPSSDNPTDFTEVYGNIEKLTADSAFALYYDMGGAAAESVGGTVCFYYGVYSNYKAGSSDIAVNLTSSGAMMFNDDESAYIDQNGDNAGNFSSTIKLTNIADNTFGKVSVAVYPEDAIELYNGGTFVTSSQSDPYFITVSELKSGETRDVRFDFKLEPTFATSYRKIRIVVFNSDNAGAFTDENRIVEKELFILCPGAESSEVGFTGMTPESVFMKGKRFAYITGTNFSLIRDTTQYRIVMRPADGGEDVVLDMDKVVVNPEMNTATLVLDMELRPTTYDIIIDWNDTTLKDMESDALRLVVTDIPQKGDPGYVSSGVYGIVTVERRGTSYEIVNYATEDEYRSTSTEQKDIMLVLRGDFNILSSEEKYNFKAEAVTLMAGEVITINDCLEVKEGRVTLTKNYDENGNQTSIDVDIDGKLYTAVANTKVWDGILAITSFEEGTLYTLPVYDDQGILGYREGEEDGEIITLLWPGAASVTQTIAGMLLNFRYGEFALMEQGESTERVIAFGASLDPSILVPSGRHGTDFQYSNLEKKQLEMGVSAYTAQQLRATDTQYRKDQASWRAKQSGTLNLYMDDILFGRGGFIGFNTEINVGIPSYADPLPYIEGTLSLKVINDYWEFGVEGEADMMVFEMEARLRLKSYKGIPVPDEIYFFVSARPGIPVDPFGVFWIRGGGAGIGEIYETFFGTDLIPPLTLMISGEFALFAVLEARADLSISAHGIEGYLQDVGIAGIEIIDTIGGSVYWYPSLSISFAIRVDILDCIIGEGGIILEETEDGLYFCGYASVTVKIPDKIWFIGGIEIGSASVGVDNDKIWGSVKVIGVGVGIRYYWGKDVEIDIGEVYDVPTPIPTRMRRSIPVYTDEITGDTLYMSIENDIMLLSDSSSGVDSAEITTSSDGREHRFTIGANTNEDALIVMSFKADNLYMAQDIKNSIKVKSYTDADNYENYKLEWFADDLAADHEINVGANAIFKYDEENGIATVSISITDDKYYGKMTTVSADGMSEIKLYGIGRLTEIEKVYINEALDIVTIEGSGLHKMSSLSIYAESSDGTLYYMAEIASEGFDEASITASVTVPANLPTGSYTLKAIGKVLDENGIEKESPIGNGSFEYVNVNQPKAPDSINIQLCGDYKINAKINATDTAIDGYLASIYEVTADGYEATVFSGIQIEIEDVKDGSFVLGGRYTTTDGNGASLERGLEAGKKYVVSIQSYKEMEDGSRLMSTLQSSNELMMAMPIAVKPEISIDNTVESELGNTGIMIDTVNTNSFTVNIKADGFGKGTYQLNDNEKVAWDGKSISLENMEDGFYTLTLEGYSETNDAFTEKYQFSVDTLAPAILMSNYQGGGFFDSGRIIMKGSTEAYSKICAYVEGELSATVDADENGSFEIPIILDQSLAYQSVKLFAYDRAGNMSMPFGCTLTNEILGEEGLKAVILVDGREAKSLVLGSEAQQLTFAFKSGNKYVTMNKGSSADSRISWSVQTITKNANVSKSGLLFGDSGAYGIVLATLEGKTAMVELVSVDLSTANITLDIPAGGYIYDTKEKTPKVLDEYGLEAGVDYTVNYVNNVNAGVASAIIMATADGRCTGTRVINFEIARCDISTLEITVADDKSSNPEVSVVYGEHTLVRDTDYTVSYTVSESGKEVIVTIEGIGNYFGIVSAKYTVGGKGMSLIWIIPISVGAIILGMCIAGFIKKLQKSKNKTENKETTQKEEIEENEITDSKSVDTAEEIPLDNADGEEKEE